MPISPLRHPYPARERPDVEGKDDLGDALDDEEHDQEQRHDHQSRIGIAQQQYADHDREYG
jgi:hypothetical protein